jgi:predicted nucleic acid-binding Zn ribbon protein
MEENNISPPETRHCLVCNKELKKVNKKFCSKVCEKQFADNQWQKECDQCHKVFTLALNRRSHYRKNKDGKVFCSRQCFQDWWAVNCQVMRDNNKLNKQNNGQTSNTITETGNTEQIQQSPTEVDTNGGVSGQ